MLFANGYFDEAIDFLSRDEYPSYGFMMANGATTLWEEWKDPRSMSHPMFGSVVKFMFRNILGIKQADNCGWDNVIIEPKTNETTGSAEGYITTEKGRISVSVDAKKNICTVSVPDGINAKVIFDGEVIMN